MEELTQLEAAYLAGLVDGEGTICMAKDACPNGDRKLRFRVRLTITNTSVSLVSFLVARYGGCPTWAKPKSKKHSVSCRVSWSEIPAEKLVLAVLPFLQIKKQQAELFLRYRNLQKFCWEHRKSSRASIKSVRSLRDWFNDEFHRLNARGPLSVEANTPDLISYDQAMGKIESDLYSNVQRAVGDDAPPKPKLVRKLA